MHSSTGRGFNFMRILALAAIFAGAIGCAAGDATREPVRTGPFPKYAELERMIEDARRRAPDLVRVETLAPSAEGRRVLLVEVAAGRDELPPRLRPASLGVANQHAGELAGTNVCLALLDHLVDRHGIDPEVTRLLDEQVVYLMPRVAVDGAEHVLETHHGVRSAVVDVPLRNAIMPADVSGDGRILTMLRPAEDGRYRFSEIDPRVLVERADGDQGPFYHQETEGLIHEWDGETIRRWPGRNDFNRQYPANWRPMFGNLGQGRAPLIEPETRAVAEFVLAHPNITAAIDYHTGNPILWPPSAVHEDHLRHAEDARLHEEVGGIGVELTGYDYSFGYGPNLNIPGFFSDWLYEHNGIIAFTLELGMLYNFLEVEPGRTYNEPPAGPLAIRGIENDLALLAWHDANPEAGLWHDWRPFEHPQLGPVLLGGWNSGLWSNPPPDHLELINERATRFFMEHASYVPRLAIGDVSVEPAGDGRVRIGAAVGNEGKVSTSITRLGREIHPHARVEVRLEGVAPPPHPGGAWVAELPHLEPGDQRRVEWTVRPGEGPARIEVRTVRGGYARHEVELPRNRDGR